MSRVHESIQEYGWFKGASVCTGCGKRGAAVQLGIRRFTRSFEHEEGGPAGSGLFRAAHPGPVSAVARTAMMEPVESLLEDIDADTSGKAAEQSSESMSSVETDSTTSDPDASPRRRIPRGKRKARPRRPRKKKPRVSTSAHDIRTAGGNTSHHVGEASSTPCESTPSSVTPNISSQPSTIVRRRGSGGSCGRRDRHTLQERFEAAKAVVDLKAAGFRGCSRQSLAAAYELPRW